MEDSMEYEEYRNPPESSLNSDLIHQDNETKENWLVYWEGKTEGNFDDWLERHVPSRINKYRDNVDWICVTRSHEVRGDLALRVAAMVDAWEKLDYSGRPHNEKTVIELAKNFNVTSGKWLFFVDCGGKADHLWNVVAHGIVSGKLTSDTAKISAAGDDDEESHVICVYNPDFTDIDQVMEVEQSVRKLGIKCRMQYKPDAYTYLGIYGGNPWGMYPYIMRSNFDITRGVSVITENFY